MSFIKRAGKKIKKLRRRIWIRRKYPITSNYSLSLCGNAYGGFSIAGELMERHNSSNPPIIYSFGIGEDLSFSESVISDYGACVFAFDPTPRAIEYVRKHELSGNTNFHFYDVGISDCDGLGEFHLPRNDNYVSGSLEKYDGVREESIKVKMKTLPTIMNELGHDQIDILKMDIEGSEFSVIESLRPVDMKFNQLCVELHDYFFANSKEKLDSFIMKMKNNGFELVSISGTFQDFTFVKHSS